MIEQLSDCETKRTTNDSTERAVSSHCSVQRRSYTSVYLEHVAGDVLRVGQLELDAAALRADRATRLDLAGAVTAPLTRHGHDDDLAEIWNVCGPDSQ